VAEGRVVMVRIDFLEQHHPVCAGEDASQPFFERAFFPSSAEEGSFAAR